MDQIWPALNSCRTLVSQHTPLRPLKTHPADSFRAGARVFRSTAKRPMSIHFQDFSTETTPKSYAGEHLAHLFAREFGQPRSGSS